MGPCFPHSTVVNVGGPPSKPPPVTPGAPVSPGLGAQEVSNTSAGWELSPRALCALLAHRPTCQPLFAGGR